MNDQMFMQRHRSKLHNMSKKTKAGFVYIMTNPAFRKNLIKIGLTRKTAQTRADELFTTGVPAPFKVYAKLKVANPEAVEAKLHKRFSKKRFNKKREFFAVKPKVAHAALYEVAGRRSQGRRFLTAVVAVFILLLLVGGYLFV